MILEKTCFVGATHINSEDGECRNGDSSNAFEEFAWGCESSNEDQAGHSRKLPHVFFHLRMMFK